jgi:hypothetical protein
VRAVGLQHTSQPPCSPGWISRCGWHGHQPAGAAPPVYHFAEIAASVPAVVAKRLQRARPCPLLLDVLPATLPHSRALLQGHPPARHVNISLPGRGLSRQGMVRSEAPFVVTRFSGSAGRNTLKCQTGRALQNRMNGVTTNGRSSFPRGRLGAQRPHECGPYEPWARGTPGRQGDRRAPRRASHTPPLGLPLFLSAETHLTYADQPASLREVGFARRCRC